MRAVIVGCGRVGALLAARLDEEGHDVTIVDLERAAFEKLPRSFRGNTLLGTGIDVDVLRQAGLQDADAFLSVTQGDNRNLMMAQIAREIFGVQRVLCKVNDPIRAQTYRSRGLVTWSRTTILSELVHQMLFDRESESGSLLAAARRADASLAGDLVEGR